MNSPARHAPLHLGLLVVLDRRLGLLDQGQDVAHAEDARRHAVGVEVLELIELLADRCELDRASRDGLNGERRAAAGVAVELREHDAVERDALLERERDVHGLLPGHRVEHEEDVRRLRLRRYPLELVHQLLVDVQAACGVEDHDVAAVLARLLEPEPRRSNGIGAIERVHGNLDLPAELLELVDGSRALEVAGDKAGLLPVRAEQEPELRGRGRLARALEARRAGSPSAGGRRRAASRPTP